MASRASKDRIGEALEMLKQLNIIPIKILEPWARFSNSPKYPISKERLWILTNLVEALSEVLTGTKASKLRISVDLDSCRYAIAIYDERGNRIYYDFVSAEFPMDLLREIGFENSESLSIRKRWEELVSNTQSRRHSLLIQPINEVHPANLDFITRAIKSAFPNFIVAISSPKEAPRRFYDEQRAQYRADLLLKWLKSLKGEWEFLMGVTEEDIYIPGMNFVFNVHDKAAFASVAILSLKRLHQEFYGLKEEPELFKERVRKQVIHIIGHFLGLPDCPNSYCVMRYVNSVLEIDSKTAEFCPRCRGRLVPGRLLS